MSTDFYWTTSSTENATGILLKIPYWMCEELKNAKD
jgi:hypothetical protein